MALLSVDTQDELVRVRVNRRLAGLRPVLTSWTTLILDYCRMDSFHHNPWWYNERTSIGTLAGAAWRKKGWLATEEFKTMKIGDAARTGVDKGKEQRGRCDLLIENRSTSYAVEAKQAWQPLREGVSTTDRAMSLAIRDAQRLRAGEGNIRVAACFTSPYLTISPRQFRVIGRYGVQEQIAGWLRENVHKSFENYAYVFPWRIDHYFNPTGTRLYPGVLLTLREVRASRGAR